MKKNKLESVLLAVLLILCVVSMVVVTVLTANASNESTRIILQQMRSHAKSSAIAAAEMVDTAELDEIKTPEDVYSHSALKRRLTSFSDSNELMFTYYIRILPDGKKEYVIDSDTGDTAVYPGLAFTDDSASKRAEAGTAATTYDGEYSDTDTGDVAEIFTAEDGFEFDSFFSAYAPVYSADGRIRYLAGVDIQRDNINAHTAYVNSLTYIHIAVIILTFAAGIIMILMYRKQALSSREASLAKSRFLSSVSHEIRTPLHAITGLTDIALRSDEEKKDECLRRINFSSMHLLSVINDVLDISKIEADKLHLSPHDFRWHEMINGVTGSFAGRMSEKKLKLVLNEDPEIPAVVFTDCHRLTQVMMNLMGNAVKFTPERGTITITTKLKYALGEHRRIYIAISDTGIGITESERSRIFHPFEQADAATTRRFGGTGLGLSISQSIVGAMEGKIDFTSTPGKGSTFFFDIDLLIGNPENIKPEVGESETPDFTGKRILVVDDIEINREIVGVMIEDTGAKVVFAENGNEAREIYTAKHNFDCILMDVQMPVMDGLEATRRIRESGAPGCEDVPIIAMTANVFKDDVSNCLEAGMNIHLGKPIERSELMTILKEYLKTQKSTQKSE
ncbi:MAG: response regulator [Ruminococcus sp.]|jgi:signal transduction histidine kinase|nr:response regulator [Ruminococcus sp.]